MAEKDGKKKVGKELPKRNGKSKPNHKNGIRKNMKKIGLMVPKKVDLKLMNFLMIKVKLNSG